MPVNRMSAISLVLSAITLALVLSLVARQTPQAADPASALRGLTFEVSEVKADIAALRDLVRQPTASADGDQHAAIEARLDSLDRVVGGIATKFTALCNAVNASPFSPQGGAC